MGLRVRVYYRWHPLHGCDLEVLSHGRQAQPSLIVLDPEGTALKIPSWMTESEAAGYEVTDQATIDPCALFSLARLCFPAGKQE